MSISCSNCKEFKLPSSFMLSSEKCFKCVYNEKVQKIAKQRIKNKCRMCENLCERHRWIYCSQTCAELGELEQKKSHWTMKIRPYNTIILPRMKRKKQHERKLSANDHF